jgi:CMP-N,N'-diacetyllegionaminic acid synthase
MKKERKVRILAVIPARGGSKGIPKKNIKKLAGKPLICWTIESALKSKMIDKLIVSTDDKNIARISKKACAEIPFMRPDELSGDKTPTLPVLIHAYKHFKEELKDHYDYIILLEPTSPGRQTFHIDEALKKLINSKADSLVSVSEVPGHYNFHWQYNVSKNDFLSLIDGSKLKDVIKRRQDLPKTYYRNGAIYAFKTKLLLESNPNFYGEKSLAYIMDKKYSVDIDSPEDWRDSEKQIKMLL